MCEQLTAIGGAYHVWPQCHTCLLVSYTDRVQYLDIRSQKKVECLRENDHPIKWLLVKRRGWRRGPWRRGRVSDLRSKVVGSSVGRALRHNKNSSEDEIANVNFLYDDIVHVIQNTIDSCINSATARRGGYVLERCLPNSVK